MMPRRESTACRTVPRPRTVAIVSRHPDEHAIEAVVGAANHDVIFVEPTAHAYSQIRRKRPDLVVVCLAGDDMDGCQVLSMLALDCETARIPVHTLMTDSDARAADDNDSLLDRTPSAVLN